MVKALDEVIRADIASQLMVKRLESNQHHAAKYLACIVKDRVRNVG